MLPLAAERPDTGQLEKEVLVLKVCRPELQDLLQVFGAKRVFSGEVRARYFDDENGSYKARGQRLRLRQFTDDAGKSSVEFITKEKLGRNGVRQAVETPLQVISGPDAYRLMTERLLESGLRVIRTEHKSRISYDWGPVHADLDQLLDFPVPPHMELEGPSQQAIYGAGAKLGYAPDQLLAWSVSNMLRYYGLLR